MDIHWRQQHYNSSCASACLAMLLSGYGIDKQDDDVITESKMPYRVSYDPAEGGRFAAGVLMDSHEVFNSLLQHHRLMLAGVRARNWAEFEEAAAGLLAKGTPFMAGVPTMAIPAPGYDQVRQRGQAGLRHSVVFCESRDDRYRVLDPSGGLDRRREHQYLDVRDQVDLMVSKNLLRSAVEMSRQETTLGYLDRWDGKQAEAILDTLNRTRAALDAFVEAAEKFGLSVAQSPKERHEDLLYDQLARCFKPIALDWRTAVEAQKNKGKTQFDLIEQLYGLQDLIMNQQKELEARPGIGTEFCAQLAKTALQVRTAAQAHLGSAYTLR